MDNLLLRRIDEPSAIEGELWFVIGNTKVHFSKHDFYLVTGLKFRFMLDVISHFYEAILEGIHKRYWGVKDQTRLQKIDDFMTVVASQEHRQVECIPIGTGGDEPISLDLHTIDDEATGLDSYTAHLRLRPHIMLRAHLLLRPAPPPPVEDMSMDILHVMSREMELKPFDKKFKPKKVAIPKVLVDYVRGDSPMWGKPWHEVN
ncbi:Uncharacterized protein TCM_003204 [Theobroma cacao]|uniref:Uncharacterized protein n=1 Tax=Theobroma cacao TaxID=3641 RepID=A0A061DVQ7_THECC|nr:Uncharacterized protein TCM_003204 [Theobroma cacao]